MLDIKLFRESPEVVKKALVDRGVKEEIKLVDQVVRLDKAVRQIQNEVDRLKHERNVVTREVAALKKQKKKADKEITTMRKVVKQINEYDAEFKTLRENIRKILLRLPNIPHSSVHFGKTEDDNKFVRKWGNIPKFSFKPKPHWELGEELDILDFERGVKLAESGFTLMKKEGAMLERALMNFMLDFLRKQGYTEVFPPLLVNDKTMTGTGQLPKFEFDLYKTDGLYLIPTAEVPVTNIHANEIVQEDQLPLYYAAYTPCFRKEAGKHGQDTRGMIRQHQFNKVEMVKIVHPDASETELETMTHNAEEILKLLKLPYQVISLCTADLGFSAAKTYDLEVWFPSQNTYREISSCSTCTDFQARRMNVKFRTKEGNHHPHTLNGSALAIGRTAIAIMENYQQKDGSIKIPTVLQKYLPFKKIMR